MGVCVRRALISKDEKETSSVGTISVQRMYKDGGIVTTKDEEEFIEICIPKPGVIMAKVGWSSGMTINMGNYDSTKIGVEVILPVYLEEIEEAFITAKRMVELRINKEIMELREYREKRGEE